MLNIIELRSAPVHADDTDCADYCRIGLQLVRVFFVHFVPIYNPRLQCRITEENKQRRNPPDDENINSAAEIGYLGPTEFHFIYYYLNQKDRCGQN